MNESEDIGVHLGDVGVGLDDGVVAHAVLEVGVVGGGVRAVLASS